MVSMTSIKMEGVGGGSEFCSPRPILVWYQKFLGGMYVMADGKDLPFALIISDPMYNYFKVSITTNVVPF